jgi:outer membrane lipoprotein-sorting protein
MTCRTARRQMPDLFDTTDASELREHLAGCGECAAAFEEMRNAVALAGVPERVCASPGFKDRTMGRLAAEMQVAQAPRRGWNLPVLRLVVAAGLLLTIFVAAPGRGPASLLAQSVEALNAVQSVHIMARMRAPAGDNFETIGPQYEFQPVEMWKEFGSRGRWRVENAGRVAAMDGTESMLFIKRSNSAVRGGRHPGFVEWLKPLLDPQTVLASELTAAQRGVLHKAAIRQDGALIVLTSSRKAAGDFTNDWARNRSITESDHTRVYRFDASTHLLTGLQVTLHEGGKDTLVFEITSIRYNEAMPDELFAVNVPDDASWDVPPEQMAVSGVLPSTAREAAAAFLDGLANRDWTRVESVYRAGTVPDGLRREAEGMQVVYIGEPFQSGIYPGWFVPYEVRLGGHVKHWNLAVRNDNPQHRWIQDGGF